MQPHTVLKRPLIDIDGIIALYCGPLFAPPRRCEQCKRLAKPGTRRCKEHPLE